MTSTTPDPPVSKTWPEPPPRPALVWGNWVTHHDTVEAVPGMIIEPAPDGLALRTGFSGFEKRLPDHAGPLAATVSLAGHLPVTLPVRVPLAGFRAVVQGAVERTPGTSAVVTLTVGGDVRSARWDPAPVRLDPDSDPAPPDSAVSEYGGQFALASPFYLGCISPHQQQLRAVSPDDNSPWVADPFPPLPLAIDLHLRRQTTDESIYVSIASLDISVLLDF